MYRSPFKSRRSLPRNPAPRIAIAAVGLAVLGVGWRLTSAEPASASAIRNAATLGASSSDTPASDASADSPPADYVPEDASPPPPAVDPLGPIDAPATQNGGPGAPLDFLRVTSSYGMRRHPILGFTRMHEGVDFAAREGAPVLAAADGVVSDAGPAGGYGNLLRIKHAGGWATGYAHLSAFAPGIVPGAAVTRGEVVAFVGHTGLATGPHLHYEVSYKGVKLDPMQTPFVGGGAADPHQGAYATMAATQPMPTAAPSPAAPGPLALRGRETHDTPGA